MKVVAVERTMLSALAVDMGCKTQSTMEHTMDMLAVAVADRIDKMGMMVESTMNRTGMGLELVENMNLYRKHSYYLY